MNILSIVGARPQFIKAALVARALRKHPDVRSRIMHTGQHYDANMSSIFFVEMELPEPDYNLEVGSALHGAQTGRMLEKIEEVLLAEPPDRVVVFGDTNSTLAGALAAVKLHIPVAHVEAGLRSYNMRMPEEINRLVVDHLSDMLFAPTPVAIVNLNKEGIGGDRVSLVGDVMYDAALYYSGKAAAESRALERFSLAKGRYVLVTIHRAENTDDHERLSAIFTALEELSKEVTVFVPLHPRTKRALDKLPTSGNWAANLRIVEPVGYLDMTLLESHARLIVTDSGGVQKEAYFHGVPCVTLRYETEWSELLEAGWNHLVPPRTKKEICQGIQAVLEKDLPSGKTGLYGDGRASDHIAELLARNSVRK